LPIRKNATHNHAIHFKLFVKQRHVSPYASTCSFGELDEKSNHMKLLKSSKFEEKGYENFFKRKSFDYLFYMHWVKKL
jgi:hypothetical protein